MAFTLDHLDDGELRVVAEADPALDVSKAEYKQYLKTLDEGLLRFKPGEEPTRFVLRRVLPYRQFQRVQNQSFAVEKGKMKFQAASTAEEVRHCLVEIENPPSVPPEKQLKIDWVNEGKDRLPSHAFMAKLVARGIAMDLYIARKNALESGASAADLKKS